MLIVEDGTGIPDADSYISIADADAYHLLFGNDDWFDLSTTQKEISLRKGTRDINLLNAFIEEKLTKEQSLQFPRKNIVGVPKAVKDATAEMALLSQDYDPTGPESGDANIKSLEQQVGSLKKKTEYFNAGESADQTNMRKVTLLLSDYLASGGVGSLMVRVDRG